MTAGSTLQVSALQELLVSMSPELDAQGPGDGTGSNSFDAAQTKTLFAAIQLNWRFTWLEEILQQPTSDRPGFPDVHVRWLERNTTWALDPFLQDRATLKALLRRVLDASCSGAWLQMVIERTVQLQQHAVKGSGDLLSSVLLELDMNNQVVSMPLDLLSQALGSGLQPWHAAPSGGNLLHAAFAANAGQEVVDLLVKRTVAVGNKDNLSALFLCKVKDGATVRLISILRQYITSHFISPQDARLDTPLHIAVRSMGMAQTGSFQLEVTVTCCLSMHVQFWRCSERLFTIIMQALGRLLDICLASVRHAFFELNKKK